ncbi:hypothetical protein BSKO_13441 [Bryopsis sp. KO-2023]|nr:hypothetical protein BSKO_13441 [Bryopsis sp. KO-2023]
MSDRSGNLSWPQPCSLQEWVAVVQFRPAIVHQQKPFAGVRILLFLLPFTWIAILETWGRLLHAFNHRSSWLSAMHISSTPSFMGYWVGLQCPFPLQDPGFPKLLQTHLVETHLDPILTGSSHRHPSQQNNFHFPSTNPYYFPVQKKLF